MKWEKPTDLHLAPRPRKQPQQSRSVQLVAAIRGACLRILDQEDVAALNTNRIDSRFSILDHRHASDK